MRSKLLLLFTTIMVTCHLTTAQVVINEISYNPPESNTDTLEFIELLNTGNGTVNIGGWYFLAGVEDTLPNVDLEPGDYYVIAEKAQAMLNVFGIVTDQWDNGALTNGGELLSLADADGNVVDSVRYNDTSPWPTEPNGNGPTLELIDSGLDNNDGTNWQFSSGATGILINGFEVKGTPGAANSVVNALTILDKDAITMNPNPASDFIQLTSNFMMSEIEIISMDGKRLQTAIINKAEAVIKINSLPVGLHMVKATTDQGIWTSLLSVVR